tara:strand:- start:1134 stop:1325 length:192 start_codon:yes stop_codon:yes gene_type:complete
MSDKTEKVADLSTFTKSDSVRWAPSAVKKREKNKRATGIVGLKGLGKTTKIKRSRTYKPKKTK